MRSSRRSAPTASGPSRSTASSLPISRISASTSYETFDDLLGYCALSAAPIGRLVLAIFDADTAQRREWSDDVCAGLQVLEHCQDVAEDRARGRIYLPRSDMRLFGVEPADLDDAAARGRVRRLVQFETTRCAALLDRGASLVGELRGWARVAVAGYIAGGRATIDAIRRCDGDVLASVPRPRRYDLLRHVAGELRGRSR